MDISLQKSAINPSESNEDEGSAAGHQVGAGKLPQTNDGMRPSSPNQKNLSCSKQGLERSSPESESRSSSSAKNKQLDEVGSTKAEMDQVMEENQRLKMHLDRVIKDYRTLEMQYRDVIQQDHPKTLDQTQLEASADQQIDLSLGIGKTMNLEAHNHKPGLCRNFDMPQNSTEEAGETWPPKKVEDDDISQQNPTKRARVSVRVRCDTPTMNDGCQWRKYGQKIAKGNPCPRAYYRCTVAPSCPVRKQVQRCVDDMSILITTYEGTHNHPLPISATAMASTTSAAASMLMSGSSTSVAGPTSSSTSSAATSANLNGLNFYLPNTTISSSPSFPTITIDLTSSSSSSSSFSSSHLNRVGSSLPRYSTTNLNFSSPESNPLPVSYSNAMLSYGQQTFNKNNQNAASLSFGSQPYDTLCQSYKTISNPNQQSLGPHTIAAATKAITSDPSFQSALAAALSSIIRTSDNQSTGEGSVASDPFPILSSFPSTSNSNKCVPSFMNKSSSSTSSQPAGLTLLSPPFPFSNSNKSKSNSTGDNRDRIV